MLIIKIHNNGTGDQQYGNYDYEVAATDPLGSLHTIVHGRILLHKRLNGWLDLAQRVLDDCEDMQERERPIC